MTYGRAATNTSQGSPPQERIMVHSGSFISTYYNADQKRAQIVAVYTAWNLWKERCRRVFDNKTTEVQRLLESIQDDIQSIHMARDHEPE